MYKTLNTDMWNYFCQYRTPLELNLETISFRNETATFVWKNSQNQIITIGIQTIRTFVQNSLYSSTESCLVYKERQNNTKLMPLIGVGDIDSKLDRNISRIFAIMIMTI